MKIKEQEKEFLSSLSENISAEELQLSIMQGLISAEISMKRQELNMSQKEFAEKANVSQSLVSRWESGECNYTLSTLVNIASCLSLEMQLPFVGKSAKVYSSGGSNIFTFPNANTNWTVNESPSPKFSDGANSQYEDDLKEM